MKHSVTLETASLESSNADRSGPFTGKIRHPHNSDLTRPYDTMASALTWLDYSERDRRRALDVIDLFRETGTVDELGLASVRDSFSDLFFPGTSTIQTRARYFLLVPWTFLRLERLKVTSSKAESRARKEELRLNDRMLARGDTRGVFGSQAGMALKRLPSEVYWGGLGSWGIAAVLLEKVYRSRRSRCAVAGIAQPHWPAGCHSELLLQADPAHRVTACGPSAFIRNGMETR